MQPRTRICAQTCAQNTHKDLDSGHRSHIASGTEAFNDNCDRPPWPPVFENIELMCDYVNSCRKHFINPLKEGMPWIKGAETCILIERMSTVNTLQIYELNGCKKTLKHFCAGVVWLCLWVWQDTDLCIHGHGWRSSSSRRCETKLALKEYFSSVEAFFCEQTEHHISSSNDAILLPCSRSTVSLYICY